MKPILSNQDRSRLDQRVAEVEKRTKTQVVLAVIKRSDSYAELPWKSFALGASIAGLLTIILNLPFYDWSAQTTALFTSAATLGGGATFALLAVFIPGFARLFLSDYRAEVEVRQYAESLFLDRELFATGGRTGFLLLVSLFERQVVLLPDKGLGSRLTEKAMQDVITQMTQALVGGKVSRALETGLDRLTRVLETSAPATPDGAGKNELSNTIVEENGV